MRIVFVTCPPGAGAAILRTLVEERLVAGGNIVSGVRSLYWWQGAICDEAEEMLWMETAAARVAELEARVAEIHPYDVPKVVSFEPAHAPAPYLAWVDAETRRR